MISGPAGAEASVAVPRARWWLAGILVLALVVRGAGLTDPYGVTGGFKDTLGAWGTAAFARLLVENGFFESGLMPYRWRVELSDGTVAREWYPHHPVGYLLLTAGMVELLGDSPWVTRLPWLLVSLLSLLAVHRLLRRVWGERVALLGAFAAAVLPLSSYYATLTWWENGGFVGVFCLLLERYVGWLREPAARSAHLRAMALWTMAAVFLDWIGVFVLVGIALHAAAAVLAGRLEGRSALRLLWLPAAVAVPVAVHALHMLAVLPWDQIVTETRNTWARTRRTEAPLGAFLTSQEVHLARLLTAPVCVLLAIGAARQLARAARGRLEPGEGAVLLALALPGPLYVGLFPYRGATHDFMWGLSMGWFAATFALEAQAWSRLARGAAPVLGRAVLTGLLVGTAWLGIGRTLELWRRFRTDDVVHYQRTAWWASTFGDPSAVVLTSAGRGWLLLYESDATLMCRISSVGQLEKRRDDVLARRARAGPVYFVIDRQLLAPLLELDPGLRSEAGRLVAYLRARGVAPSFGAVAGPDEPFEIWDLTAWAEG